MPSFCLTYLHSYSHMYVLENQPLWPSMHINYPMKFECRTMALVLEFYTSAYVPLKKKRKPLDIQCPIKKDEPGDRATMHKRIAYAYAYSYAYVIVVAGIGCLDGRKWGEKSDDTSSDTFFFEGLMEWAYLKEDGTSELCRSVSTLRAGDPPCPKAWKTKRWMRKGYLMNWNLNYCKIEEKKESPQWPGIDTYLFSFWAWRTRTNEDVAKSFLHRRMLSVWRIWW